MQSQISRAITRQSSAYSKVARAAFESLSRAIVPPSSITDAHGLTSTRKLLYQSDVHLYNSMSVLSAMFTDIFQTLAADPDISVTDLSFPEDTTQNVGLVCDEIEVRLDIPQTMYPYTCRPSSSPSQT